MLALGPFICAMARLKAHPPRGRSVGVGIHFLLSHPPIPTNHLLFLSFGKLPLGLPAVKLQVRQTIVSSGEATGPCKARALAQQLWDGEEFYLQASTAPVSFRECFLCILYPCKVENSQARPGPAVPLALERFSCIFMTWM